MEEKLRGILNHYEGKIQAHETIQDNVLFKMNFCKDHNFNEEVRVLSVQYLSIDLILSQFRTMHKEITELLNSWES